MPDMPSVPRDAALDSSSLARGAANLRERPVDSGAVNAGVLALQDLGQAVKEAAGVPSDFSLRLQKAQNTADIARADVIMRDAFAAHQDRMQGMPEAQWEETWKTEGLKSVREQIDALGLSQAARDQLTPDLIQWEGATSIQVRTQATKQTIGNNRLAVKNAVDRSVMDGDYELAISHYKNGVKTGLFSPEEGDAGVVQIEERVKAKAKEDQANGIASAIEMNPAAAIPELRKNVNGEPSIYGEVEPIKAQRMLTMAENELKNRKIELRTDLHNRVISGEILDPETLRKEAGGKLDEKALQSLEKTMGKEIPFDPETFSKLRTRIAAYDADADQDGTKLNEIMTGIETTIPQNRQGPLNSELSQTWNATVRGGKKRTQKQEFTTSLLGEIDNMADRGVFGKWKEGTGEKALIDENKKMSAWSKAEAYKEDMRGWLEKNQDATPAAAMDHFKTLLNPDMQAAAAQEFANVQKKSGPSWWSNLSDAVVGVDMATTPTPETVTFIKELEGLKLEAYGDSGQTSIGYGTRGTPGERITKEEADRRLTSELSMHAKRVDAAAREHGVKLTPNQRQALISFDFNTGAAPVVMSSKDPDAIASRMAKYKHADAKAKDGVLVGRRNKELALFYRDSGTDFIPFE